MIKALCIVYVVTMMALVFVWLGASPNASTKECVEWKTVYPTPTPVPMAAIYTEWIPFPGKAPDTGYGWIQATDFIKAQKEWPPKNLQVHILTDEEYNNIAKEHGMALTQGGQWTYGFPPIQGFHRFMGGVILKNSWLPERLHKVVQE